MSLLPTLRPAASIYDTVVLRGCTQINPLVRQVFSDRSPLDHCVPKYVRQVSDAGMPAQDISPAWEDWADAASRIKVNTKRPVISRADSNFRQGASDRVPLATPIRT